MVSGKAEGVRLGVRTWLLSSLALAHRGGHVAVKHNREQMANDTALLRQTEDAETFLFLLHRLP